MVSGDVQAPRHAALIMTSAFLGASCLYGAYLGGQVPVIAQTVTSRLGFAIDQVKVSGHRQTSEIDVLERLGLDGWTSTIGFDAEAARARIAGLPWVESVEVRKIYPGTLQVAIVERRAFAVWQRGTDLSVIERSGHVIVPYSAARDATLPLVIGVGAPEAAPDFVDRVRTLPELASRIKAFIRIGERRWDVRLENGVTVRLPESSEDDALHRLVAMDRDSGLLSRDIKAVDMRLSDRLVVQLSPEALTQREAAFKEMLKAQSKQGKKI
jgi:cell division protein FtsQ